MVRDLLEHRDLLWLLTLREIRIRYARAVLGLGWALFVPVAQMAAFTVLDFGRLLRGEDAYAGLPYSVYAFVGILPWTHFAASLAQATPSLVVASNLLKKSAFPREVIPLSKVLAATLDLLVGTAVLGLLMAWHGITPGAAVLAVPAVFLLQFVFTVGLALLLSAGNLFFRDVNYLVSVGLLLGMFATSVVWPVSVTRPPWAASVLALNPMTSFLDAYREAILLGRWPWGTLLPGAAGAVLSILVGAAVFRRLAPRFAEEV